MNNPVEILIVDKLKENISFKFFFMGLAKNTGKTTTLNYVRKLLQSLTKQKIILISTGYDGEESDALSGLPKPKIFVTKGNVFITAEYLLTDSNNHKILNRFSFQTPFGKIILVEALSDVSVCLVSPGNNESTKQVIQFVESIFEKPIFLLDGSINRKSFLRLSTKNDLLILSTGAAFSTDLKEHMIQIDFVHKLFLIRQSPNKLDCKQMQTIDDADAKLMKNEKILLPDISTVFMTPRGYSNFFQQKINCFMNSCHQHFHSLLSILLIHLVNQ